MKSTVIEYILQMYKKTYRTNLITGFYTKKVSYRYKRTKLTEMVMQNRK